MVIDVYTDKDEYIGTISYAPGYPLPHIGDRLNMRVSNHVYYGIVKYRVFSIDHDTDMSIVLESTQIIDLYPELSESEFEYAQKLARAIADERE